MHNALFSGKTNGFERWQTIKIMAKERKPTDVCVQRPNRMASQQTKTESKKSKVRKIPCNTRTKCTTTFCLTTICYYSELRSMTNQNNQTIKSFRFCNEKKKQLKKRKKQQQRQQQKDEK